MSKYRLLILLILMLIIALLLISGCGKQPTPVRVSPTPSPSQTLSPSGTPLPGSDSSAGGAILNLPGLGVVSTIADAAPTRTPAPTATPDALTREILKIVQDAGLSGNTLLWLSYADWINLVISLLYVLAGYLVGTWLIRWLLPRLVSRTKTNLDDRLLHVSGNELRWLAVALILRFAVNRLSFIQARFKTFIADVSFFLALFLVTWILWRLINLAALQADERARKAGRQKEAESLIMLSVWALRLVVIVFVIFLLLTYFGVNITGFAFFLGLVVLVLSLAGRDILTDIVSGAIILIDRPFRIGDRLELSSIDSWGDVVDIGMRSTRILSAENRMVVIPNSQIGKNQIVNYSYPDPSYFNTVNVLVAYDNDPDQVSRIIVDAIRSVEGVQTNRDVVAWLIELNEYHMLYWASWWVANFADRFPVQDQVNRAIKRALHEAGVVMPYPKGRFEFDSHDGSSVATGTANEAEEWV